MNPCILHFANFASFELLCLSAYVSEFSDPQTNGILISGVSATGEDEYLRAAFLLRELAKELRVPLSNVVVVPSTRDLAQLRSFSDAFYWNALGRHFSPCVPQVVTLDRLQIISFNAIQQGQAVGIGEQQFFEMGRLPELAKASKATRLLLTSLPFGRWSLFPQMGFSEWALKHRLFEITTETISPPLASIRQFVTEPGTLQVLTFEPDTGFILGQTYRRIFGNWELVDASANPRQWETHFLKLERNACYTSRQVSIFIAKRTNQWDQRHKFLTVINAVSLLKGRLVLSFPEMSCAGIDGASINADTLDLSDDQPRPAFFGWRWIDALKAFPAVYL